MQDTIHILMIVCPLVFLGGFVDAIAGGGGLLTLPAYLLAGLPPHMATATNKCSSIFGTGIATYRFMKEKKVYYLVAISSAILALFGSYLGASLNIVLDERYLEWVLVFAIPIIAVIVLLKKEIGKEIQVEQFTKRQLVIRSLEIGFIIGIYDGFLGPGTGTFLILAYCIIMKFDMVTASGNAKVVNLASNFAAFVTFAMHGSILWHIGIVAAVFGIVGNYLGAGLAVKKGARVIKPMFVVVLVLLLTKMIGNIM